ncbi:MAG: hypothetical protein ACE5HU_09415, partial [Acidobacteriota bacterium]
GSPFPLAADPVGGPLRSEPLAFLEGHPILRWTPLPLPRLYLEGLDLARYKNMHVEGPGYLNGALSRNGWWSFFLLALTMKSTLPFLILAAGGIALAFVRPRAEQDTVHRAYIATPAIGLTLLITAFTHAQIGLRYILPVLVFLALAGSAAMMRLLGVRRGPGTSRSRIAGCLLAGSILFGWHAVSALRIHPYHLAYFNEAWGGPDKGYLHLVDSNLDWGQDLVGLRRFMDEHGLDGINLYYFGTADPRYYGIERYVPPRPGYFAVSVTHLMGVYLPDKRYLAPLRAVKPLTTIGHSIWVFKIGKVPDFLEVPPGPS